MIIRSCLLIVLLIIFAIPPVWAGPAPTRVGPYTVLVESVGRVLDFTQSSGSQRFVVVTLAIEGPAEAMSRVLEKVQDPAAVDDQQRNLQFQQVCFPPRLSAQESRRSPTRSSIQVWFLAPPDSSSSLADFSASLVCYEKKERLSAEFVNLAGEQPSAQSLDSLSLTTDFLGPQEGRTGKTYQVRVEVKVAPESSTSSAEWEKQWANEQVELIDADGAVKLPITSSRTYQYGDNGQVIGEIIIASFELPARPPRGVRYQVDRVRGVQTLPYRFEELPLP